MPFCEVEAGWLLTLAVQPGPQARSVQQEPAQELLAQPVPEWRQAWERVLASSQQELEPWQARRQASSPVLWQVRRPQPELVREWRLRQGLAWARPVRRQQAWRHQRPSPTCHQTADG